MTPDDERELFDKLARIDRRLSMLGGCGIGAAALYAAYRFYDAASPKWGNITAAVIAIVVAGAIGWYLVREFDR